MSAGPRVDHHSYININTKTRIKRAAKSRRASSFIRFYALLQRPVLHSFKVYNGHCHVQQYVFAYTLYFVFCTGEKPGSCVAMKRRCWLRYFTESKQNCYSGVLRGPYRTNEIRYSTTNNQQLSSLLYKVSIYKYLRRKSQSIFLRYWSRWPSRSDWTVLSESFDE